MFDWLKPKPEMSDFDRQLHYILKQQQKAGWMTSKGKHEQPTFRYDYKTVNFTPICPMHLGCA
jgi:hypothetical protein